ncbi:MAG: hypothetical protein SO116_03140 [Treponema sp.]|nr:hypothetical protein [Treponema sp.]
MTAVTPQPKKIQPEIIPATIIPKIKVRTPATSAAPLTEAVTIDINLCLCCLSCDVFLLLTASSILFSKAISSSTIFYAAFL